VIRVEQACAVLDALRPDKILVLDSGPWRMTGLTVLDKPALGLDAECSSGSPRPVASMSRPLAIAQCTQEPGDKASVPSTEDAAQNPLAEHIGAAAQGACGAADRAVAPRACGHETPAGGSVAPCGCAFGVIARIVSIAPSAAAPIAAEQPYLVLRFSPTLGRPSATLWIAEGGRIIAPQTIPFGRHGRPADGDVEAKCREVWSLIRNAGTSGRLFNHRGIDLRAEMLSVASSRSYANASRRSRRIPAL